MDALNNARRFIGLSARYSGEPGFVDLADRLARLLVTAFVLLLVVIYEVPYGSFVKPPWHDWIDRGSAGTVADWFAGTLTAVTLGLGLFEIRRLQTKEAEETRDQMSAQQRAMRMVIAVPASGAETQIDYLGGDSHEADWSFWVDVENSSDRDLIVEQWRLVANWSNGQKYAFESSQRVSLPEHSSQRLGQTKSADAHGNDERPTEVIGSIHIVDVKSGEEYELRLGRGIELG